MKVHHLAAVLALMAANPVSSEVITVNGAFTATGWSVFEGNPNPPIDPIYLIYSVTFDTDLFYLDETAPLTIISTNFPGYIGFSYNATIQNYIMLSTYGLRGGCGLQDDGFCAFIKDFQTGLPYAVYQSPEGGGSWTAGTITPVPEPASWALMIAGFGLIGAVSRRRRVRPSAD